MKEILQPKTTFVVELTLDQVTRIRGLTQNYPEGCFESSNESKVIMSLFVGASRLLGYDMSDDGTIKRGE
jgi:hypothetical protein